MEKVGDGEVCFCSSFLPYSIVISSHKKIRNIIISVFLVIGKRTDADLNKCQYSVTSEKDKFLSKITLLTFLNHFLILVTYGCMVKRINIHSNN